MWRRPRGTWWKRYRRSSTTEHPEAVCVDSGGHWASARPPLGAARWHSFAVMATIWSRAWHRWEGFAVVASLWPWALCPMPQGPPWLLWLTATSPRRLGAQPAAGPHARGLDDYRAGCGDLAAVHRTRPGPLDTTHGTTARPRFRLKGGRRPQRRSPRTGPGRARRSSSANGAAGFARRVAAAAARAAESAAPRPRARP